MMRADEAARGLWQRAEVASPHLPGPVIVGTRCAGKHAAPWQQGFMIWDSLCDAVAALRQDR